jgi:carboxyl-terminal processing protease
LHIIDFNAQRARKQISLNEAERRQERDQQEARQKARESRSPARPEAATARTRDCDDGGLQSGERNLAVELATEKARKNEKDVLLNEAVNVLGNEVGLLTADARLVFRGKPPEPAAAGARGAIRTQ